MSNVVSFEEALSDSTVLADLAEKAGLTLPQAKEFAAELSTLPIRQVIRICHAAWRQRMRGMLMSWGRRR